MLNLIKTRTQELKKYKNIISKTLYREINNLSKDLKGLRVVHINSTSIGGGVAEILKSLVPIMKGIKINAEWYTLPKKKDFFELTKEIHNGLQGKKFYLNPNFKNLYRNYVKNFAKMMLDMKADIWVFHDPQPAGIIDFLSDFNIRRTISRIHIDTSSPNLEVWNFCKKFLLKYNKIIFSSKEFICKDFPEEKIAVFPPAIDPLTEKNTPISLFSANKILRKFGINTKKPLISQISRFDPWKDPVGVIKSYRLAKKKIPSLQLALIGLFLAYDDPEAMKVFDIVKNEIKHDKDIFLFSDPHKLEGFKIDKFINAFQKGSNFILQKSIKEGFGLTVAEAMWKQKPVIGGNVGGIKIQINNGKNGFLVSNYKQASDKIVELIKNPDLVRKMGKRGKSDVRNKFLMPRLIRDYLKLFKEVLRQT